MTNNNNDDYGAEETKFPFYKFTRSHIITGVQLLRVSECVLEEKDSLKDSYEKSELDTVRV